MCKNILEYIGWIGTALVLLSYALLASGMIGNDIRYHGILLVGSAGVAIISYHKQAWQPLTLNVFFVVFALIAITRIATSN